MRSTSVALVLFRQDDGAGGLPLRQAPRGRCLASPGLKPRSCPGGWRRTVPFILAKYFAPVCFDVVRAILAMNAFVLKIVRRGWALRMVMVDRC